MNVTYEGVGIGALVLWIAQLGLPLVLNFLRPKPAPTPGPSPSPLPFPLPDLGPIKLPDWLIEAIKILPQLPPGTHRPIITALCRAGKLPPEMEIALAELLDSLNVPAPLGADISTGLTADEVVRVRALLALAPSK